MTAFITTMGALWHIIPLAAVCVALPLVARGAQRHDAKYVFFSWQPNYEVTGITSPVYTCLVGLLMAQSTMLGYDASAHWAEETVNAEYNVPRAMVSTIGMASITGYAYILALTFCQGDSAHLFDPDNETGGLLVVLQILWDVFQSNFGNGMGGAIFMTIPALGNFFCCFQSISSNSRMLYAVARDDAVPMSWFLKKVNPYTRAPVRAAFAMTVLTLALCIPMCFNVNTYLAIAAFCTVGMYVSYAIPLAMRLITGRRNFIPGPFYMGHTASRIVSVIAVSWISLISVLFCLPQFYPINSLDMNYASTGLGVSLAVSLGWWYFPVRGARHWFKGPQATLGKFDDSSVPDTRIPVSPASQTAGQLGVERLGGRPGESWWQARRGQRAAVLRALCFGDASTAPAVAAK